MNKFPHKKLANIGTAGFFIPKLYKSFENQFSVTLIQ